MAGFAENPMFAAFAAVFIFFAAAAGVMVILWIVLPFSVFGTKGLLRRLIEEQEKTNALLKGLLGARKETGAEEGAPENREGKKEEKT